MTDLVPADRIESAVGARRHPTEHVIRGREVDGLVYVLHPDACRALHADLRGCPWSLALDRGVVWLPDEPVVARLRNGEITTAPLPTRYLITKESPNA